MAYALQAANVQARIKEEEMQVKVVERQQEIKIQEQECVRRERELDSKIKKPAEAEKFRLEKIAEAEKTKIILQAEAHAESLALKGEAEAFAMEAKARAEAQQMAMKAEVRNIFYLYDLSTFFSGLEGVQGGRHGGHDDAGHAEGSGRDQRPDVPGEEGHDGLHRGRSCRGREGDGRDHGHNVQPPGHCEGHDWGRYIPEND